MCAYKGVTSISFSENFAYVLNKIRTHFKNFVAISARF